MLSDDKYLELAESFMGTLSQFSDDPDCIPLDQICAYGRAVAEAAVKDAVGGEPVAVVDASDDGWFASILPDTSVKLGQLLYTRPQASAAVRACEWSPDGDDQEMPDTWDGSCGARWTFTEGGPAENTMNFCPQCGGRVHVAASKQETKS